MGDAQAGALLGEVEVEDGAAGDEQLRHPVPREQGSMAPGRADLLRATAHCLIGEFLNAGYAVRFTSDTLHEAHQEGYDNCAWCLGGSTR